MKFTPDEIDDIIISIREALTNQGPNQDAHKRAFKSLRYSRPHLWKAVTKTLSKEEVIELLR